MRIINSRTAYATLIFLLLMVVHACKKDDSPPAEAKLDVKLSSAAIETSPSNTFNFSVTINSQLPAGGVKINVDVKREDNNASVYSIQASSNSAANNFTISPLPPGQIYCLATITVTSVSTATNTWSGTFRVLWK